MGKEPFTNLQKERAHSPDGARRDSGSRSVTVMVEGVIGCKWTLAVLAAVRAGIHRPGEIERACSGISTKVLNERLKKLIRFGILLRETFPEIPPRVEYRFTRLGERFCTLLDEIADLQEEIDAGSFLGDRGDSA